MKTKINPSALYWTAFERFEFRLSGQAVIDCSHPGQCDSDVARHAPLVRTQMERDNFKRKPTPDLIRAELKECGAWKDSELTNDETNWQRIVWLATGNIAEESEPDCSAQRHNLLGGKTH